MRVGIISGGFDPIHPGHLEMINQVAQEFDQVVCIVNSDGFLISKKGYCVQNWSDRITIMENIKGIFRVIPCVDFDNSVAQTLAIVHNLYPTDDLTFCNGGDRLDENMVPQNEKDMCRMFKIKLKFGYGRKIRASSDIVKRLMENINKEA